MGISMHRWMLFPVTVVAVFWWGQRLPASALQPPERQTKAGERQSIDDQLLDDLRTDEANAQDARSGQDRAAREPSPTAASSRRPQTHASGSTVEFASIDLLARQMQDVASMLGNRDVSDDAIQGQNKIVEQLDQMIAALRQRQLEQQQSASQANQDPSVEQQQTAKQDAGMRTQAAADGPGKGSSPSEVEPGAENWRQAMGEYWGHLPERVRSQIQSSSTVGFLPRYRELIEAYYQRLSEDQGN